MGRSSKQQPKVDGLREPHVSGAYIRRLVKQLTSSNTTKQDTTMNSSKNLEHSDGFVENPPQPNHPPPQQKKQVRRRLHTSRPYQERLMNMAEARREIVTALKFHRASMKQAQEQQQQQQLQQEQQNPPPVERIDPKRSNFSTYYVDVVSPYSSFPYPPPHQQPNPFTFPASPVSPLPFAADTLNFTLPTHPPLGLNLNFHDFDIVSDNNMYTNSSGNATSSIYSSSPPSSSSSPAEELLSFSSSASIPQQQEMQEQGMHQVMDDEEMAEIRSLGEQHQIEWNDTVNLMTSAWWCNFLKGIETGPESDQIKAEEDGYLPFDEVMEFPPWLNGSDSSSSSLEQHLDDCFSMDYFQDPALPCMDIGEIEGLDGEWLS